MRFRTPLLFSCLSATATACLKHGSGSCSDGNVTSYDYVIIGSGPGGGPLASNLAQEGYSVFLIEAGDDESDDPYTLSARNFALATLGTTKWGFYVSHYEDLETTLRYNLLTWKQTNGSLYVGTDPPDGSEMLGVYYPRGATLGGSAIVNAQVASLPANSDWDEIAELTGEESWSAESMREIFETIEKNVFLPEGTEGHGFDGWVTINQAGADPYNTTALKDIYGTFAEALGEDSGSAFDLLAQDGNSPDPERDFVEGMYGMPSHVDDVWKRFSARDLLLATASDDAYDLTLQLNSLATKVLLNKKGTKAIGVEYLEGAGIYSADDRYDSSEELETVTVYAKREVIVAGGTFNSPQLLQLSGIGNCTHLESVGVKCLVDLPGVGTNLQENYELPILGSVAKAYIEDDGCVFGSPTDPCLAEWVANKTGPYAQGGTNSNTIMLKTANAARGERDEFLFSIPGSAFPGYYPNEHSNTLPALPENVFDISTLKMHPYNRAGSVMITTDDPRVQPEIKFNYFTEGMDEDLDAIEEVVAWGRRVMLAVPEPYGPMELVEPPCEAGVDEETGYCTDRDEDRQWIIDQAFGHHCTSTCAMGADDDKMAVLDGKFKVRGVEGLRVVDASTYPKIPGGFPSLPTFMISQKATDFILGEMEGKTHRKYYSRVVPWRTPRSN
ncbi:uncharacterized protein MKZ38_004416 [Zalerion maritima]|uniref:Glucose-methanol-choline oxidoreductase N-terminal domain-containing protein n=1 Tax=Zalerion maritima TaxID=339359 RepID=A0AAD5RLM3_9PEZI|nr:uncharacterized protein MKZ38_004416 [Zalerion maritima]